MHLRPNSSQEYIAIRERRAPDHELVSLSLRESLASETAVTHESRFSESLPTFYLDSCSGIWPGSRLHCSLYNALTHSLPLLLYFDYQVLSISFIISMGHSEVKLNTECEALLTALPVTDMAEGVRMS